MTNTIKHQSNSMLIPSNLKENSTNYSSPPLIPHYQSSLQRHPNANNSIYESLPNKGFCELINVQSLRNQIENIEEIFQKLIQKSEEVVGTKNPPIHHSDPDFNNFKRRILVGVDINNVHLVFFKWPWGKWADVQRRALKNEELAFYISHALGFNVIPPTKIILKEIFTGMMQKRKCVVQSAVSLASEQSHLDGITKNKINFSLNQVHQVILFNMLTGRRDARPCNTVLDIQHRFIEIDNEDLGSSYTDSWLLEEFRETDLSPELISDFLLIQPSEINNVFERMAADAIVFDDDVKENILDNFSKIKHLFETKNKISVFDLIQINENSIESYESLSE